nr:FAD-dependent oxidoreductase [Actinomyces radicidentis]
MVHRIEGLENVEVRTGVEPTIEDIEALHPDVLVNATGSVPLAPPIQGLRERADQLGSKVRSITTVMDEAAELAEAKGRRVVVVGGGAVGLDVVELFAENNDVTVVERLPMVGRDLDPVSTTWINHVIEEYGVKVMTETDLVEVRDDSFLVSEWGDEHELPFDLGFVCLGMKANANGVAELTQHFTEQGVEVLNIGDSRAARRIIDGTREARNIVVTLRDIGRLPAPATV